MRALVFAAALLAPLPAMAQAYQCRAPVNIGPLPLIKPDGPARRAPIGGYTLAASWSPEYCKTARDRKSMQCSVAVGRFGFVLHGLWPESAYGAPPQWCAITPMPDAASLRANLCMSPSPYLLAHEWAKHGSCMARRPADYYRIEARLWRGLQWPDADRLARRPGLTAGGLRAAFIEGNPGWRAAQIGLLVSDTGWLREIHLCYDRRLRATACPRAGMGPTDATPLKIWRGL